MPALIVLALIVVGAQGQAAAVRYTVRPGADLATVDVEVRYDEPPGWLLAADGDRRRLTALSACSGRSVDVGARGIATTGTDGCVRYRYPLETQRGRRAPPVADSLVLTNPATWLWTPDLETTGPLHIRLSMPDGMAASVPWRTLAADEFRLERSPGSATASVVLGRFESAAIELGDARLRVALVHGPGTPLGTGKLLDWLKVAAMDVAGVGGSFPHPEPQVIVQPVGSGSRGGGSPVPFGYVVRHGGETVRFFVSPERPLPDYLDDWTATHEFSHLLLPYVRGREKWVSEGFASYYQNVLLARRGAYTEAEAWRRLQRSFERARQIPDPPPLDGLHRRSFWQVRMLVYWTGAAMALQADARLREASGGRQSLDTVLGRLRDCCLPSPDVWTAAELFARLDAISGTRIFSELHAELRARPGMPDLSGLYRDLGLVGAGSALRLDDDARLAALRAAIMGGGRGG